MTTNNGRAVALRQPDAPGALVRLEPAAPNLSLDQTMTVGATLARSGFFKDIRSADQAVAKILWGAELGIGPVSAIRGIWVIESQLSMSGNLMATLVKSSAEFDYRVRRLDNEGCLLEFYQRGELLGPSEFTKVDALAANLLNKNTWKQYPRAMYFNRAISQGFRIYCPHLSGGAPVYTPEELDADVDETGAPLPAMTVSEMGSAEADQDRRRGRFFGRAKELGYVSHTAIHAAMGVPGTKDALGAYVRDALGGDWGKALDQLEEAGHYVPPAPQAADQPPEAPAEPEGEAQQLPCWQCGAVLATRELNGEPACETCFTEAQEQAAAAQAATPMPAGLAVPGRAARRFVNITELLKAAGAELGLRANQEQTVSEQISALIGTTEWKGAKPEDLGGVWAQLVSACTPTETQQA